MTKILNRDEPINRFGLGVLLGTGLVWAIQGCATTKPQVATEAPTLIKAELGQAKNIHRFGDVWLAGQPNADDLKLAKEQGVRTVLNLRKPEELDWHEADAARGLKLNYVSIGFKNPTELTDTTLDDVRGVLNDSAQQPLLVHCASANRVGAVWLAHRMLDSGLSYDEAYAEAKEVGLNNPAYLDRVMEYVQNRLPKTAPAHPLP